MWEIRKNVDISWHQQKDPFLYFDNLCDATQMKKIRQHPLQGNPQSKLLSVYKWLISQTLNYPLWAGTCSKGLIAQLNPWASGYRGSCFILVSCLYLTELLLVPFPTHATHPVYLRMRVAERLITFIVGFHCYFLNKLLYVSKIQIVCCLSRDRLGNHFCDQHYK